jgi:hypothetical protein
VNLYPFAISALLIGMALPSRAATLCNSSEKPVFSCLLKNKKTVSICEGLLDHPRPVTYRFGTAKRLELEYAGREGVEGGFKYGFFTKPDHSSYFLGFVHLGYEYEVVREHFIDDDDPSLTWGVVVGPVDERSPRVLIECASDIYEKGFTKRRNFACDRDDPVGCSP